MTPQAPTAGVLEDPTEPTEPTEPTDHPLHEGEEAPPPGVRAMALIRWLLLAAIAVVAAAAWWSYAHADPTLAHAPRFQCPMHPQITAPDPGECPICHMALEPIDPERAHDHAVEPTPDDSPTVYRCPMHPEQQSLSPGTCAICKMDLEPVARALPPPGTAAIQLSLDRRQSIGVRMAQVQAMRHSPTLRAPASLQLAEAGSAQVHVRAAGFLEKVIVAETGVRVHKGQRLADLYSPEIYQAQAELLAARRWSGGEAGNALASARQRLELLGMSGAAIDRVIASGKPARTVAVEAPAGGVVVARSAVLGAYVGPETPLYEIRDRDTLYVIAEIPAGRGELIAAGAAAALTIPTRPGFRKQLSVDLVYPELDREARSFRARLTITDPELRAGEYAIVEFALPARDVLVVPRDAVLRTGTGDHVFRDRGEGRLEPRVVTVGLCWDELCDLVAGVAEGDHVVSGAAFLVDAESRLRAAMIATPE